MTTDEKVDEILEICHRIDPMVKEHHQTLYGNGQPGLSKDIVVLQQGQKNCPARLATTAESKKLSVATGALIVAIIVGLSSIVLGAITLLKK